MPTRRLRARLSLAIAVVLSLGTISACTSTGRGEPRSTATPTAAPSSAKPATLLELKLAVYGPAPERPAFEAAVEEFNKSQFSTHVTLTMRADRDEAIDAVNAGDRADVFMISRRDLPQVLEADRALPVDQLLDERGVDFGDGFNRDAVSAFGHEGRLRCMPYGISPMVVFINTDLVDFNKLVARGIFTADELEEGYPTTWTIEQFAGAARLATHPARRTRGFWIEPTLAGLAPFIYSGGGKIFDDTAAPTSLDFSSDETREALTRTLAVLRNAPLTLTQRQLHKASALDWFKRGRVAMIAGSRSLVPELRGDDVPPFDVLTMPTLDRAATVGDLTGLCIATTDPAGEAITPDTERAQAAADLIAFLVSDAAVSPVVEQGYLVPANNAVAGSDAFLQPGQEPAHPQVFTSTIRGLVVPPLLANGPELSAAVAPYLSRLLTDPGQLDLELLTEQIDEISKPLLAPSPSATPSD